MAGRALRPVDSITIAAQRIAVATHTAPDLRTPTDEIGRLTDTFNQHDRARLETSSRKSGNSAAMLATDSDPADRHEGAKASWSSVVPSRRRLYRRPGKQSGGNRPDVAHRRGTPLPRGRIWARSKQNVSRFAWKPWWKISSVKPACSVKSVG
ncbi:MAG: HAMP domain-containing protein [Nitrospira sp.]|nr:HAMP domain-containing protein [Nitrospira sp.]